MFVNFNNTGSNQFLATTQAVGEEGGEISTRARFEEGGEDFATTLALHEEGGGDISTRALYEEGGQTDHFSTQQALRLQNVADADKDGVLTKAELDAHVAAVKEQLRKIEAGEIVFFADPTPQIQAMKQQLRVADFMKKNFDAMADVDDASGLSARDIRTTANQDFRPHILSQSDVDTLNPDNGQNQIHQWILQILQWFQMFLGGGYRF